tara:strand:+ start:63 stop:1451 length:1389 start_codon:yes stop_codon:yes gene_type:complete
MNVTADIYERISELRRGALAGFIEVTEVNNRNGTTYTLSDTDSIIFNTWTGGNGTASINLPTTTGNEGRIIRFKSDDTIGANKKVVIRPDATGETIDGASSYDFDRSYDGVSLLCYDDKWFIIQKKEKSSGGGGGSLNSVADDTSPQLGGNLDVDGNDFTSAGDVKFVVDSDSNTADSAFIIENGAGTVLWKINESGITSGLLTTTTPTLSGAASSYSQSSSVTGISVSNHVAGRTYKANIYNSSGTVQTGLNPAVDSSGNVTFTAPASTGTGFELRISALDDGKFESVEVTATFEVTASRTFEYWRVQCVDSSGNASANKAAFVELDFYTGANATGTETPTTDATSETSISGVTISAGTVASFSGYDAYRAFDGTTHGTAAAGSMWWTLGNSNADLVWIQLRFSSAQTFQSLKLTVNNSFNDATHVIVKGSNTGNFSGEEVSFGLTAISETGSAGITTINF